MTKISWKPGTLLYPVPPALVSCGSMEHPNAITIAWTGIVCSDPAMTYISVRPSRYSYGLIKESGEFVINLVPRELAKKADFCGMYTGRKVDKFKKCALTPLKSNDVSAPTIEECPINIECKVSDIIPLGSHDMFLADILSVNVDEKMFEGDKICINRAHLCAYAHGEYYELAKRIGKFGFSVKRR